MSQQRNLIFVLFWAFSLAQVKNRVNYCFTSAVRIPHSDLRNVVFEECIKQQIENEQDENEINSYLHDFVNKHRNMQRGKRFKRQVYQPPQVDEKLVSAFLNSPEAVKMVLSYLNKQKPPQTTTTTTTQKPLRKRPGPPPLSFFFGGGKPLSQLIDEHRKTLKQIKAKPTKSPPKATKAVKPNLQFFGPKDFVPKDAHNVNRNPMRLKYSSTKQFPSKTYGRLVPMPR